MKSFVHVQTLSSDGNLSPTGSFCVCVCVRLHGKYIQDFFLFKKKKKNTNIYLFIWLHWVLVEACVIFVMACGIFRHGM